MVWKLMSDIDKPPKRQKEWLRFTGTVEDRNISKLYQKTYKKYKDGVLHSNNGPAHWQTGTKKIPFFQKWYKNGYLHREGKPAVIAYSYSSEIYKYKWFKNGAPHRTDGPAFESGNKKEWFINGQRHREDGPAFIYGENWEEYFIKGRRHREDGPAVILGETKIWYKNGKIHRDNGPAVEFQEQEGGTSYYWLQNGKLHREDGPAIELCEVKDAEGKAKNFYSPTYVLSEIFDYFPRIGQVRVFGEKQWYIGGKLHREDGPAIERPEGEKRWFKQGKPHRTDGPAVIYKSGSKEWWVNGELHRNDGPAVEISGNCHLWIVTNLKAVGIGGRRKKDNWIWRANAREYNPSEEEFANEWWRNGKLHRNDGPAIERSNGERQWWVNGKRHRVDGPAVIHPEGSKEWWVDGDLHRDDGPAVDIADGYGLTYTCHPELYNQKRFNYLKKAERLQAKEFSLSSNIRGGARHSGQEWWRKGKLHREDGPAIDNAYINGMVCFIKHTHWFTDGKHHREDGPAVIIEDTKIKVPKYSSSTGCSHPALRKIFIGNEWWKNGELHREGAPAVEYKNGQQEWWKGGKLHRENGPAVFITENWQEYWNNGQLHREDGPARVTSSGNIEWWRRGNLHRDNGPAIEGYSLDKEYCSETRQSVSAPVQRWFKNGYLHREDGPAVIYHRGSKEWWVNGRLHREDGPAVIPSEGYNLRRYAWCDFGKMGKLKNIELMRNVKGFENKSNIDWNKDPPLQEYGGIQWWENGIRIK